jgi:hypothetical protein
MIPRWPRTLSALAAFALCSSAALAAQDDDVRVFTYNSDHPRIGVMLDYRADKETDKLGAKIQNVSPGSPAEEAGLKAGDIITRFNGVALGGAASDDDDESGPAAKLVELVQKTGKGDSVDVEYRRGSDSRKTRLATRELPPIAMNGFRMEMPEMGSRPRMRMRMPGGDGPGGMTMPDMPRFDGQLFGPDEMRGDMMVFARRAGGGLNLTDLNPGLGEYFGAKSGVLVLETPKDSASPFKAGDVIVTIDGRAPTSEAHARRIFESYDAGESAKVEVLRKQKKMTLTWKAPNHDGGWKTRPDEPLRTRVKVERS